MNNKTLKIAIHRLASRLTSVDVLYYNLGKPENSEQIVFYLINDSPDGSDSGNEYATVKVQFNVFSKEQDNGYKCDDMLAELQSVMSAGNLTMDDGSKIIHVKKDFIIPSKKIENVWQSTIQYSIHIKKV